MILFGVMKQILVSELMCYCCAVKGDLLDEDPVPEHRPRDRRQAEAGAAQAQAQADQQMTCIL